MRALAALALSALLALAPCAAGAEELGVEDAPAGGAGTALVESAEMGSEAASPEATAEVAPQSDARADDAGDDLGEAPPSDGGAAAAAAAEDDGAAVAGGVAAQAERPVLHAQAHVQNEGWMGEQSSGGGSVVVGTWNRSLRVESLRVWVDGAKGSVEGRAHVQDVGWQAWAAMSSTDAIGTTNRSLRVEALRLRLSSELREAGYSLYYRLHVQDFGWLGWAKDGALAGTAGYAKRAEAIELRLVGPGEQAPEGEGAPYRDRGYVARAHVQDVGWQDERSGYSFTVGTTGRAKRVEALTISRPSDDRSGDVVYEAHVQNVGWQGERRNGQVAGTSGQSLRLEAIRVYLTGELNDSYDVWYRVHAQDIGWMAWTKDGQRAGTQGYSKRLEAVQVAFVAKGDPAPPADGQAYGSAFFDATAVSLRYRSTLASGEQGYVSGGATSGTTGRSQAIRGIAAEIDGIGGSVTYQAHLSGSGWTGEASDGGACGGGTVEAVRFKLSGDAARMFDVWYRAHVSKVGWLDWAANGADAGSTGMSLPVEAYQVRLVPKGSGAPGSTSMACARAVTGDQELDVILTNIVRNVTGTGPDALRRGYNYMMGYPYRDGNDFVIGTAATWETAYAKEMYNVGSGNCYRSASLMSVIARALGYNARTVAGGLSLSYGIGLHGWTEIRQGNQVLILDPNMGRKFTTRNFFMVTYAQAPAIYHTV